MQNASFNEAIKGKKSCFIDFPPLLCLQFVQHKSFTENNYTININRKENDRDNSSYKTDTGK